MAVTAKPIETGAMCTAEGCDQLASWLIEGLEEDYENCDEPWLLCSDCACHVQGFITCEQAGCNHEN